MKKNINKMVLNDDINDPSLFYSDRPILLDIDDGFNNSDDDNDIGF